MQPKCRLKEETTSKPCQRMTVLIEDRESDTERDVCQILEMFSPILLKCLSLCSSLFFFWSWYSAASTKDFIIWVGL